MSPFQMVWTRWYVSWKKQQDYSCPIAFSMVSQVQLAADEQQYAQW